jgi:hypothetical protein
LYEKFENIKEDDDADSEFFVRTAEIGKRFEARINVIDPEGRHMESSIASLTHYPSNEYLLRKQSSKN